MGWKKAPAVEKSQWETIVDKTTELAGNPAVQVGTAILVLVLLIALFRALRPKKRTRMTDEEIAAIMRSD